MHRPKNPLVRWELLVNLFPLTVSTHGCIACASAHMSGLWGWTVLSVTKVGQVSINVWLWFMHEFLTNSRLVITTWPGRVFSGSRVHCVQMTTAS